MLALIAAAALAATSAPAVPAPSRSMPPADSAAWSASEEQISRGLVAAWRRDPNRRVCATYTPTGTTQRRSVCGTLQSWFNGRNEGEIRRNRAPQRLVDEVKERRADARSTRQ